MTSKCQKSLVSKYLHIPPTEMKENIFSSYSLRGLYDMRIIMWFVLQKLKVHSEVMKKRKFNS